MDVTRADSHLLAQVFATVLVDLPQFGMEYNGSTCTLRSFYETFSALML